MADVAVPPELLKMSTEELMKLKASAGVPANVDVPPELLNMSTEELMKLKAASAPQQTPKPVKPKGMIEKYFGGRLIDTPGIGSVEAGLALASAPVAAAIGGISKVASGIKGRIQGNPDEDAIARQYGDEMRDKYTYVPRGEFAKDTLTSLGKLLEMSKLPPYVGGGVAALASAPGLVSGSAAQTASTINRVKNEVLPATRAAAPEMRGAGAAMTEMEALRRERADNLRVPIKLTKGDATREFDQQQFEKETAKTPVGAPLRERADDNVGAILKNIESWFDDTGASAPGKIEVGKRVDAPLVKRMESAKTEIRNAYDEAKAKGDMAELVDIRPLAKYLQSKESVKGNAPVVDAAEKELFRLGGGPFQGPENSTAYGKLALSDIEELRKMVGTLGGKDATNGHYAKEIKAVIDQMTEGKGGDLYKKARSLHKQYSEEFKDQAIIRDLVGKKPGTSDRKVALEDVWQKIVIEGSNEDWHRVKASLEKAGPEGAAAIRELEGYTAVHLYKAATDRAPINSRGQPIPSYPQLRNAVRSLDDDGKLEAIFGKQKATEIRDLVDTLGDVTTTPPGTVNHSNTASALMNSLASIVKLQPKSAAVHAATAVKQIVKDHKTGKQVKEALQ